MLFPSVHIILVSHCIGYERFYVTLYDLHINRNMSIYTTYVDSELVVDWQLRHSEFCNLLELRMSSVGSCGPVLER